MWRNDIKFKYMFLSPLTNLARKVLNFIPVSENGSWWRKMRISHGTTCSIYRGFIGYWHENVVTSKRLPRCWKQTKGSPPVTGEFPQNGLAIHNLMLWWIGWWLNSRVVGHLGCLNTHMNSLWCRFKRWILLEAWHKLFGWHTCIGGTGPTARRIGF